MRERDVAVGLRARLPRAWGARGRPTSATRIRSYSFWVGTLALLHCVCVCVRASAYASIRSLFSPLGRPVCIRGVPSPPRCLCRSIWEPFCVHTSATTTVNEKVCGACKDSLSAQGACTHAHLSPATARAWCRRPGDHAAAPAPRAGLPTSRPCRILCACGADASGACGAAGSDATPPPLARYPPSRGRG